MLNVTLHWSSTSGPFFNVCCHFQHACQLCARVSVFARQMALQQHSLSPGVCDKRNRKAGSLNVSNTGCAYAESHILNQQHWGTKACTVNLCGHIGDTDN